MHTLNTRPAQRCFLIAATVLALLSLTGCDTRDDADAPAEEAASEATVAFAENAFPPTIPDTDWHRDAWRKNNCLVCHASGINNAPRVEHKGMPRLTLQAKCRTCHVLIEGAGPKTD